MAIVKNPFLSGEARGSVGSMTATIGIGGPVMKKKPIPVRRVRRLQPRNRSILGFLSREWSTLTDAQRQAWRDWATDNPITNSFGDPFVMSGINAYTRLNSGAMRLGGGGAIQTLPPAGQPAANFEAMNAVTGVGNPGEVDLTWSLYGTGLAADFCEIWVTTPYQSQGRVEVTNYSYASKVAGNIALVTVAGLQESFWYWFRGRYIDQYGQMTAWLYDQATPMLTP